MEKVWKSNQAFAGNESPGRRLWLDRLSPVDKQEVLSCIRGHKHSVDFFFFFNGGEGPDTTEESFCFFLRSVGLISNTILIGRFLLSAPRSQLEEIQSSSSSFLLFFFILLRLLLPRRPIEAATGGFSLLCSVFVHFSTSLRRFSLSRRDATGKRNVGGRQCSPTQRTTFRSQKQGGLTAGGGGSRPSLKWREEEEEEVESPCQTLVFLLSELLNTVNLLQPLLKKKKNPYEKSLNPEILYV